MCSLCVYNDLYELDRFVRAHVLHNDKLMYQRRRYQQQQRRQQQKKVLIPWKKNFIFCGGLHSGKMQTPFSKVSNTVSVILWPSLWFEVVCQFFAIITHLQKVEWFYKRLLGLLNRGKSCKRTCTLVFSRSILTSCSIDVSVSQVT